MSQELFHGRPGPGRLPGFVMSLEHREKIRIANRKRADDDIVSRARRDKLVNLLEQGFTNRAAAIELGTTKSAIGKMIWRMQQRGVVIKRLVVEKAGRKWTEEGKARQLLRYRRARPKGPVAPRPPQVINHPPMEPVGLLNRTGCAFPINDGGPFLFCNNPKHDRSSYCEFHGNLMVRQE